MHLHIRRLIVVVATLGLTLGLMPAASADHPAIGGATFTPGATTGVNAGGAEGIEADWDLLGSFFTGNPHSDLDFFSQDGATYATVGTLAAGANGGGQTIVKLMDADGTVDPEFVASFPSASCITDPASATGLQHDVEATPKGGVPLNTDWGSLVDDRDAQLIIDASDARGRCHDNGATGSLDAPRGGLEIIDITDVENPTEIALISHIGESHTVNVDPSRPHIVYSVTSDSVSVSADTNDCNENGNTEELIRINECSGFTLDGFEILDISSCLDFPADATIDQKRGIGADGAFVPDAGCRPEVFRFRYDSLDIVLGHTNIGGIFGCHELEIYPEDELVCASGSALIRFDIAGMFDDNGTPNDRTDDTLNGDPLPCRLRPSTSGAGRMTDAPVIDCVNGGTDAQPIPLQVSNWLTPEVGAPSIQGIEHISTAYHAGRESATGSLDPAFTSDQDIDFNHEVEFTHSRRFVLASDERGGGILPGGSSCTQGVDNPVGNGGVHAYVVDQLLTERPVPVTTAGDASRFDPELAFESYARTPEGEKAIYRANVRTGAQATICVAHVFQQVPGQNRIFMGWYSQGTQVVDYIEHDDGTFEFREVAWFIPEETNQWVSHIFDIREEDDGSFTYVGATGDFRLTDGGRNAIDVYSVNLPAPAQFAAEAIGRTVERVEGTDGTGTAVAVSQDAFPNGSDTVLLGRIDEYADNLAGGPLAASEDAPLLYTDSDELSADTATEIDRLGATRAIILGGTAAVSQQVEDQLRADGLTVTRLGGSNRFETAALIAAELGSATGTAFVVEGENADPERGWPDPLSVAPLAGFRGDPILLVNRDRLPDETSDALSSLGITDVVIAGGDAAVSPAVSDEIAAGVESVSRLAGDTRFQTSLQVYEQQVAQGMSPTTLTLATGLDWPDALAAGPVSAIRGTTFAVVDGQGGLDTLDELLAANLRQLQTVRRRRRPRGRGAGADRRTRAGRRRRHGPRGRADRTARAGRDPPSTGVDAQLTSGSAPRHPRLRPGVFACVRRAAPYPPPPCRGREAVG
jgi:putative cell wall-binding protein